MSFYRYSLTENSSGPPRFRQRSIQSQLIIPCRIILGENGVLDQVFAHLQLEQIVRIKIESFFIDSTSGKVHPHGAGALEKVHSNNYDAPSGAPGRRERTGAAVYAWSRPV